MALKIARGTFFNIEQSLCIHSLAKVILANEALLETVSLLTKVNNVEYLKNDLESICAKINNDLFSEIETKEEKIT